MIQCVCASCNATMQVPENYAGATVQCKNCKQPLKVPSASAGAPPAGNLAPAPGRPPVQKPAHGSAPGTPPASPAAGRPPVQKPMHGSAPGASATPPVQKPMHGSAPGASATPPVQKPMHGSAPGAKAPSARPPAAPEPHAEVVTPALVLVEAIRFACPHCHGLMHAWPNQLGATIPCPGCKQATKVPSPVLNLIHGMGESPPAAPPSAAAPPPAPAAPAAAPIVPSQIATPPVKRPAPAGGKAPRPRENLR
jgi:hypothetical protein